MLSLGHHPRPGAPPATHTTPYPATLNPSDLQHQHHEHRPCAQWRTWARSFRCNRALFSRLRFPLRRADAVGPAHRHGAVRDRRVHVEPADRAQVRAGCPLCPKLRLPARQCHFTVGHRQHSIRVRMHTGTIRGWCGRRTGRWCKAGSRSPPPQLSERLPVPVRCAPGVLTAGMVTCTDST